MDSIPSEKSPSLDFRQASYLISAAKFEQCPEDSGAEVAFAGRSNAGKSSALNVLTDQKKLARTSKTPGRTQLINFFALNDQQRLVDLPGYGYAKVPEEIKIAWQKELDLYLRERQSLKGLILLCDARHLLKDFDMMMLEWASSSDMPVHILLTKADKLKAGPAKAQLLKLKKQLPDLHPNASAQLFSSLKRTGLDQAKQKIAQWLELPESP